MGGLPGTYPMNDMSTWFPSPIAAALFTLTFVLWAASEVYNRFASRHRQSRAGTRQRDRGSYWIILLIVLGSLTFSGLSRVHNLGVFHNNLQYLGLGMALVGIAFREWAVLSLGRFFSVIVAIAPTHTLVTRGPYRWIRHPAYTGSMLTLVGFPLALGTWLAALVVCVLCVAGFCYRVHVEERVLVDVFGDAYRAYCEQTWRFFPGL